ncbi:hypothetical protein [Phytohabitans kaempferiae]|uniref:ATP synthase protein I n=1 Tax=Phytohabitans kaempferiae TaxID=1620943 RepID=A0ABV6M8Y9_9ACTN
MSETSTAGQHTPPVAGRLGHLPHPLAASAVLVVVLAGIGWLVDGGAGGAGAAAGVLLVAGGYALSSVALAWAESVHLKLVMTVGLATFVFKVTLFGFAVFTVSASGWDGTRMLGVSVAVATVVWVSVQIWWTARAVPSRGAASSR